MKHLTAILLGCFFTMTLSAQTIKIKDDIATVDGTPYCIIEKSGTLVNNYSIKSLDKNELIYIKTEVLNLPSKEVQTYHVVTILETEETFEIEVRFGMAKFLVKEFYDNKVIQENKINPDGLKKFKIKYAGNFREKYLQEANLNINVNVTTPNPNPNTEYLITERNRNANLFIINGKVSQGGKEIATYKTDSKAADGKILKTIKVYNMANQLVAQAENGNFEENITFITLKDNKKHQVKATSSLENNVVEAIINELAEYLYL
jgi:hypothetical protein